MYLNADTLPAPSGSRRQTLAEHFTPRRPLKKRGLPLSFHLNWHKNARNAITFHRASEQWLSDYYYGTFLSLRVATLPELLWTNLQRFHSITAINLLHLKLLHYPSPAAIRQTPLCTRRRAKQWAGQIDVCHQKRRLRMRDYGRDVLRFGRRYWKRHLVATDGCCLVLLCESFRWLVGLQQPHPLTCWSCTTGEKKLQERNNSGF